MQNPVAKHLPIEISKAFPDRLGDIWKTVDCSSISWTRSDGGEPDPDVRSSHRTLEFHVSGMLYLTHCELDFVQCTEVERPAYISEFHEAVGRASIELGGTESFSETDLCILFGMFHKRMRGDLKTSGRKNPVYTLEYWRKFNEELSHISPVPFNKVSRAALSAQASSASAERLFSNIERFEGR